MNRRVFLRNANMAAVSLAAGGGLLGCVKRPVGAAIAGGSAGESAGDACHLPRVRVSAEREIRTVVGLRPFRPSGFRVAKEMVGETVAVHNYGTKFVRQFDGMIVEPPIYLPAMLTDVRIAGGKVVVREMKSLDAVRGLPEKIVFNCTGLGAKALFGDEELTPIRGQLTFLVPQPEVTYATSYENTYMFSRRYGVLPGGTHEMGDWNLQPDLTTKAAILAKQASLFEGMRDC